MKQRQVVVFFINGVRHEVGDEKIFWMLADYLRIIKRQTGTKIVCAEGDCGACSVLKMGPFDNKSSNYFKPINSCIATVAQMDGCFLVSVEGITSLNDGQLSLVQKAMLDHNGSQCGFCTPGFIMAITGIVEKKLACGESDISVRDAKNALTGNLCRCTGYTPIINATVAVETKKCTSLASKFAGRNLLKTLQATIKTPIHIAANGLEFFAPTTIKGAVQVLQKHKNIRILAAGTDLGVAINKRKMELSQVLSLHLIPELYKAEIRKDLVVIGARVTLSELRTLLKSHDQKKVNKVCAEIVGYLDIFASPQIKNAATLVGNVVNASPIGDTPAFLLALDATVHMVGPKGKRKMKLKDFYLGYRKTDVKKGELVTGIEFGLPSSDCHFSLFKASQRKDLDISAVNAGFFVSWEDHRILKQVKSESQKQGKIQEIRLAIGGVAATPIRLKKTEAILKGKSIDAELIETAALSLQAEISPISDLRGSAEFRRLLAENFFRDFLEVKI